jgi:hypothetical protein
MFLPMMTLTYLDTCQLVQERNGKTCELAFFTEVSSAVGIVGKQSQYRSSS